MGCKSFKPEVFYTIPICGLVFGLVCASLITNHWVEGVAKFEEGGEDGRVTFYYGLFSGYKSKVVSSLTLGHALGVVCLHGQCMFSCADSKKLDIEDILGDCPYTNVEGDLFFCENSEKSSKGDKTDKVCDGTTYNSTEIGRDESERMFGVGLFATVGMFLILGLIFTLLSGLLGVFNAFSNPIEWYTGLYGLVVLHSISACLYFLVSALYGGLFDQQLKNNAPISDVIRFGDKNNWSSNKGSSLGYSYWLILCSFFLHVVALALVGYFIYKKYKPKRRITEVSAEQKRSDHTNMLF
ncbi:hypothetical protein TCAL_07416 [Tigriopus californicus]|uniref:Clarin-1 n=1 Tax=Tigriopus californicus TaxID=6832 RepID=A0A553PGJ8_TIGCA|nr:uncharacterized protein LOC131881396 [Tigriopus californicus]TRY76794.1 hypothetical protein TCAL_07416 [Tigriopus californicus]|eukprot:TCALIF_07416-PA protein Name:"Protein of unknown function" AED:0.00 eAED:0.00 QI:209/1/1/1/0.75/0.6/5/43/296